jgi:hypothetical protein
VRLESEHSAPSSAGFDPVQTPPTQVSVCVQRLPSLQEAPSGFADGAEHWPDDGSQVPAT